MFEKNDKCKVCSLPDSTLKILGPGSWPTPEDSQFFQALRYQNRSKGLVWHYINIDAMYMDMPLDFIVIILTCGVKIIAEKNKCIKSRVKFCYPK